MDLLVEFLNTLDEGSGEDELGDLAAATGWFRGQGLPTKGLVAAEARRVRDALRAAADGRRGAGNALAAVPLRAEVVDGAPRLRSDDPLGALVATAVGLAYEGRWDRLKLCGMESCRYVFYDESRNRSGRWCSMAVCGNRAKTRAFRERHRLGS